MRALSALSEAPAANLRTSFVDALLDVVIPRESFVICARGPYRLSPIIDLRIISIVSFGTLQLSVSYRAQLQSSSAA